MSVIKTFRAGFAEIVGLNIHYMGMLIDQAIWGYKRGYI